MLERVGGAWTVEDRGSSNGTLVNTTRINGPHVLHDGDIVPRRAGPRSSSTPRARTTCAARRRRIDRVAPNPTESQRHVLVELCRPALERGGGAASNREIAAALFVSVETVKTHMRALFDAFEVGDVPQYHKRTELVRRALETGLVSVHDLASGR